MYPYEKKHVFPIEFTINNEGKPDGIIKDDKYFKTFVKNGIVYKYEKYQENHKLWEEKFMQGDTIISKYYNSHVEKREEYWELNNKTIYDYNCSYSEETDSIISCHLRDKVKGIEIYTKKGIVREKTITKNLPKDIIKQIEEYDENGKLLEKQIKYNNNKTKTIHANGNYTIETEAKDGSGIYIEKYSKSGKLIEKSFAHFMGGL